MFWPRLTFNQQSVERALLSIRNEKVKGEPSSVVRDAELQGWQRRASLQLRTMLRPVKHGLKEAFLKRFLDDLVIATGTDLAYPSDWGQIRIRREWQHIDLLIESRKFIVFIENKTQTRDHSHQLSRYLRSVEQHFPDRTLLAVYLTTEGDPPRERDLPFTRYSYAALSAHLAELLQERTAHLTDRQRVYLEDYLATLKRHIMGEDERKAWVAQLFHDHSDALNFLLKHKPNPKAEIKQHLEAIILENHWKLGSPGDDFVRFLPPESSPRIRQYRGDHPWAHKESLLFEIWVNLPDPDTIGLEFRVVVSPASDPEDAVHRNRLITLLNSVKQPSNHNSGWLHYFAQYVRISGWIEMSWDERRQAVVSFIAELSSAVHHVDRLMAKL